MLYAHIQKRNSKNETAKSLHIGKIIPWFILGFLALVMVNSLGYISADISEILKKISKFLMVSALAAIGLNTDLKDMKKAGLKPMVHGFIISLLVVLVSILVIYLMGEI